MTRDDDREKQAVLKLKRRSMEAAMQRDIPELRRELSEDFVVTYPDGRVGTADEMIADFESGALTIVAVTADELDARLYGKIAVLRGRQDMKVRRGDQTISAVLRFTEVLLKRRGRWQFVASQSTPLAQGPAPSFAPP